jgi:hypothetical protein
MQRSIREQRTRGQILVVFVIALTALLLAVGLVIDAGYGWSQRRTAQNSADLSAIAGARIVGLKISGATATDGDVMNAISVSATGNGSTVRFGLANDGPQYVDVNGAPMGLYVGTLGVIPATAQGVMVRDTRTWRPLFLGVVGVSAWSASANATAKAGYLAGAGGGDLLPIAVSGPTFFGTNNVNYCPGQTAASSCTSYDLTTGGLIAPGQFGWMSWDGTGTTPYLCSILGPPAASPIYTVADNGFLVLSGNTGVSNSQCVDAGIAAWVAEHHKVTLPIVSPGPPPAGSDCVSAPDYCYPGSNTPYPAPTSGQGSSATYNIIGFAGFELTSCTSPCIKNISGVFRKAFFLGPTIGTPQSPGEALGVQLVQ